MLADFGCDYDFACINMLMQVLLNSEVARMIFEEYQLPITAEEYAKRSSKVAAEVFATNARLVSGACYRRIVLYHQRPACFT